MDEKTLLSFKSVIKELPPEATNANIIETVNKVLLSVRKIDTESEDKLRSTLNAVVNDTPHCPMVSFLKDFKNYTGEFESSQTGAKLAVEYLNALQDFALKTNAEEAVISEINKLLALISE